MSNTADHVGRAQTITALGRQWTVARLERRLVMEFLEHVKTKLPDPKQVALEYLAALPAEDVNGRNAILQKAMDESLEYLSLASPRVQRYANSEDGMAYQIYLLLRGNHPEITVDMASAILEELGRKAFEDVARKAAGVAPQKKISPGNESNQNGPPPVLVGPSLTAH